MALMCRLSLLNGACAATLPRGVCRVSSSSVTRCILLTPSPLPSSSSQRRPWRRAVSSSAGPGKDEEAFSALRRKRLSDFGPGPWLGLALLGGVGLALVYFFWEHRRERNRRASSCPCP